MSSHRHHSTPFLGLGHHCVASVFDSTMVLSSVSFGLLTPDSKALNEKLALLLLRFAGDGELAATSFAVLRGLNARSRPLRDIWAGSAWAPR